MGERILEFAFDNELIVENTWFKKKPEHLVSYQSGIAATQIHSILFKRSFRKHVSIKKGYPSGELCITIYAAGWRLQSFHPSPTQAHVCAMHQVVAAKRLR